MTVNDKDRHSQTPLIVRNYDFQEGLNLKRQCPKFFNESTGKFTEFDLKVSNTGLQRRIPSSILYMPRSLFHFNTNAIAIFKT